MAPKDEVAGLGQAVAEARDLPQMLKTTSREMANAYLSRGGSIKGLAMSPKGVADHFINHKFGWVPFVKDMSDTINLVSNYDSHLQTAIRRNGTWRKRYFVEDVIDQEETIFSDASWHLDPVVFPSNSLWKGSYTIVKRSYERIWYKGLYKNYRTEFDNKVPMHPAIRKVRQALTLGGANVNPSLLWKVTPWSWCVDWFSNFGDSIRRTQDLITSSTVTQYFYLMRHRRTDYVCKQSFTVVSTGQSFDLEWTFGVEMKQRAKSENPFTFSLNPRPLSGVQLAILAALGISKAR